MKNKNQYSWLLLFLFASLLNTSGVKAQVKFDGDFRLRWYSDVFNNTMDNREKENYMRVFGRLRVTAKASDLVGFNAELSTVTDNPDAPTRNISGTGSMHYALTQIYGEINSSDFLFFDATRVRLGRQQFQLGNGLCFGESSYYYNKFDGARVDFAYDIFDFTAFGAITGQNLSTSGLYPDPGSDQIYVLKGGANVLNQDFMAYYILDKPRGVYNDSYILGTGVASNYYFKGRLEYFAEFAYQKFNTAEGTPRKAGIGYMGGAAYHFSFWPFKSIKLESKYAAYQGDNKNTTEIEMFSPRYPNFFWGERTGYVNGEIGGDYPYNTRNPEGCRIWYSRIYFIPYFLPKLRLQFQYTNVNEYKNNDGYNSMDDEWAIKAYYTVSRNATIQLRYARVIPKGKDYDLDNNGSISSSEDRMGIDRYMFDFQISF